jgi:aspartyl-tRNA(Asn)/glutamyl-tRNA(Gln) amidotransferase subunit C
MISREEVQKIAKLARLGISEKEEEKFQKDLSSILDYFSILNAVNVSGIEPFSQNVGEFSCCENEKTREDRALPENSELADELIGQAPEKSGRYIKVKAIF